MYSNTDSISENLLFFAEDLMSIFEAGIPSDEPFVVQRDALFPEDIIYSSNPNYNREESRATNRANTSHNSRFSLFTIIKFS